MDVTGIDLAALGTAVGSILATAKSYSAVKKDRADTKIERDNEFQKMKERQAVLEEKNNHFSEMLKLMEKNNDKLESRLNDVIKRQDITNDLLTRLTRNEKL